MTDTHAHFLEHAIAAGLEGMRRADGGPFGAILVRDGAILARGWNRVLASHDPTAHAEIEAIRAACASLGQFHLTECLLYASCEPCPMCLGAIYWARIKGVFYAATRADAAAAGFADERLYRELPLPPDARSIPFTRIPLPSAEQVFAEYNARPGKGLY